MALTWKYVYYAGNTLRYWLEKKYPDRKIPSYGSLAFWNPFSLAGRHLWLHCLLPYVLVNFVALPALFLLISEKAALFVLINLLLAEMLTNLHSFAVIVTNHTGDDVYRFETSINSKEEFYFRQITGSVNYPNGTDFKDFMHGYLNYQIEHHLWPDLSMLQYRKAQPLVQAIALKHCIPYVQESVPRRVVKTVQIMCGFRNTPILRTASTPNANESPILGTAS
jgi:fatty acid desaturase